MKKNKLTLLIFSVLFCFILVPFCFAQEVTEEEITSDEEAVEEEIIEPLALQAEAGVDKNVAVGRNVAFDASTSAIPPDKEITYHWDFGDGQGFDGIDASHIYDRAGQYLVNLTVSDGETESRDFAIVFVEEEVVLLITDDSITKKEVKELTDYAHQHGVLLVNIKNKKAQENDYLTAQKISQQLLTSPDDLQQASLVILWTSNNIGLNALSEWAQIVKATEEEESEEDPAELWKQKIVINTSDKPGTARIAQNTYDVLSPKYILLTNQEVMQSIIENPNPDRIISTLNNSNHSYQIISSHSQRSLDKITPFNFMSYLINYLINKGVNQNTIFLILILPVVATIISFARQIVGVKAFGIYVPSIMALTLLETDLKWGLFIFLVLLIAGTLARLIARRLRLLYMPRMAIVLTIVALAIFATFVIGGYFNKTGLLAISIFPIIVMIILTEKFIEAQIEKGNKAAIKLTIETLILAIISFYIVSWESFKTIILAYPELILLTLALNLLFGRFTGLRIFEYFRFRKLLKNVPQPKKQK